MGKRNGYWAATVLFGLVYFGSGVGDLLRAPPVVETLQHLGFPLYLATILGPLKIAAVVVLLLPRLPRLKEWAYAGIVFDLTGAIASHAIIGDPLIKPLIPLVLLVLAAASYNLRSAARRLASDSGAHAVGVA